MVLSVKEIFFWGVIVDIFKATENEINSPDIGDSFVIRVVS
jgi:hypothetical protein